MEVSRNATELIKQIQVGDTSGSILIDEQHTEGHTFILGSKAVDYDKFIKCMVYGMATDTNKKRDVYILDCKDMYESILKMPYVNKNDVGIIKLIEIKDLLPDTKIRKKLLTTKDNPVMLVVNDIEDFVNSEDENIKAILDLILYISNFGKVFNTFLVTSTKDASIYKKNHSVEYLVTNSENCFILKQSSNNLELLRDSGIFSNSEVDKIKEIKDSEMMIRSK